LFKNEFVFNGLYSVRFFAGQKNSEKDVQSKNI